MFFAFSLIAVGLYLIAVVFLASCGLHSLWLLGRYLRNRPQALPDPISDDDAPAVLIQLPVYNERDVVERVIESAGALDWPKDRLRIQLLDDSDDDTQERGATAIARLQAAGIDATHVRRPVRVGYKAGALSYGMDEDAKHPDGPAEFIAIFDADFMPYADFLRKAVPDLINDDKTAFVQGRWEHANPNENLLTIAQAVGIDGHFAIEQGARAWSGWR